MQTVVVSVGGSLIAPQNVSWEYIRRLRDFIENTPHRWIIVVGGGGRVRTLNQEIHDDTQKDFLGIAITRVNAQLVISQIPSAYPEVLTTTTLPEKAKVYVSSGFTPGRTTDDVAVQFALAHNAPFVINLTNVDGVLVDGKVKPEIEYEEFLQMFPSHKPGINAPFDPVATQRAQQADLPVYIVSGKDFSALTHILSEKPYLGTVLR